MFVGFFYPGLKQGIYGTARVAVARVAGPEYTEIPGIGAKIGSLESKDAAEFRRVTEKRKSSWAFQPQSISGGSSGPAQTSQGAQIIPGTQNPEARACKREAGRKEKEPVMFPVEVENLSFFLGALLRGFLGDASTAGGFCHRLTLP